MNEQHSALTFSSITITRSGRRLVDDVSFSVGQGSVHALLGHNGAGKTTLMRGLAGLVTVQSGAIATVDEPAVLFVGGRYPGDLSVGSIIEHRARLLGGVDPSAAVKAVGVDEFLEKKGSTLSTGMTQRLSIALALLSGTRLFVLDEPTTGLDPQGVEQLRDVILGLKQLGSTVLVCSHDLAELELICDAVTCMRNGRVTVDGSVLEVSRDLPRAGHILRTSDDARAARCLAAEGIAAEPIARGVHVPAEIALTEAIRVLLPAVAVHEVGVDKGLFARIYDAHASAPQLSTRRSERHR